MAAEALPDDPTREQIRAWCTATARALVPALLEGAADRDRERQFPHEQLDLIRARGLEAILVPRRYGGIGGEYSDQARVVSILAEGDPSVAQIFHVHGTGVELLSESSVAESVKAELHARTVAGKLRWTNAYSELGTKTIFDWTVKLTPTATGSYLVDGQKFYCTGSLGGDYLYATAVVDGTADVRLVFVPTDAPGLAIDDDWSGMGQVTTGSGTIRFAAVEVPAERVIDFTGLAYPESVFGPYGQICFSGIHLGIARNALGDAVQFAATKARPWVHSGVERAADDPYTQQHIGQMSMWVEAADALQERALDVMDAARAHPSAEARARCSVAVSQAKAFTEHAGLEVCQRLFQVTGSASTVRKYDYDRHWRNLRTLSLHDPVDYKFKMIGDYHLNGTLPPITAYT